MAQIVYTDVLGPYGGLGRSYWLVPDGGVPFLIWGRSQPYAEVKDLIQKALSRRMGHAHIGRGDAGQLAARVEPESQLAGELLDVLQIQSWTDLDKVYLLKYFRGGGSYDSTGEVVSLRALENVVFDMIDTWATVGEPKFTVRVGDSQLIFNADEWMTDNRRCNDQIRSLFTPELLEGYMATHPGGLQVICNRFNLRMGRTL